jgi:hypothetical protein
VTYLFEKRHFDEFLFLERWWHNRPFEGAIACPFRRSVIQEAPYRSYRKELLEDVHHAVVHYY